MDNLQKKEFTRLNVNFDVFNQSELKCLQEKHAYTKVQVDAQHFLGSGETHIKAVKSLSKRLDAIYHSLLWRQSRQRLLMLTSRLPPLHRAASRFLGRVNGRVIVVSMVMIFIFSGLGVIAGSQWTSTIIRSRGNVKVDGVGVYEDNNCSIAVTYLDWGTLEPGCASNIVLYIRNEGNHVESLFMASSNWNPIDATDYMSLNWNYDGKTLDPMETVEVTLTLSISPTVENIADFSFDVIIGVSG